MFPAWFKVTSLKGMNPAEPPHSVYSYVGLAWTHHDSCISCHRCPLGAL